MVGKIKIFVARNWFVGSIPKYSYNGSEFMSVQEFKSIFVGQKAFNLRLGAYIDIKT